MDRVTVISACSGHGFKHSAGIGETLAMSLAEDTDASALAPFALKRFANHGREQQA
jgi:sarcosine oxidase